ncbi:MULTISPECIES: 1,2-phenylacetyl-CoA epoxidase subunit PaaC [unclassified Streptomyces]|uniref:Phenylacetate-CoA oxygenase subunit PaaC n=1 Tax=Streptomyces sp. NBC_00060 TaxID=2975636 RepID=A0AAU2HBA0_9ACTN
MTAERTGEDTDLAEYVLRLGDDALVLCQRLCALVTRAPTIEEDLALSNIALDLLGHARTLLAYSGRLDGTGRGEDELAYHRTERQFRNALLVELPSGDFAVTIARQLVYAHYSRLLWTALEKSSDDTLAAFGARAAREVEYHQMHADQWTVRLGRGTAESRRRMQAGLDLVWPYAAELFAPDALVDRLDTQGSAIAPARLREEWEREVTAVLDEARLAVPSPAWQATGGRDGLHTEAFAPLLAEFRSVRLQYPGGTW